MDWKLLSFNESVSLKQFQKIIIELTETAKSMKGKNGGKIQNNYHLEFRKNFTLLLYFSRAVTRTCFNRKANLRIRK